MEYPVDKLENQSAHDGCGQS